jgi:hypothetical protein
LRLNLGLLNPRSAPFCGAAGLAVVSPAESGRARWRLETTRFRCAGKPAPDLSDPALRPYDGRMDGTLRRALTAFPLILLAAPVSAQFSSGGGVPPPPSFQHELTLIVVGAVFGGFLGPLLQILDAWIGITPGIKQQRANYAVQREIAAHLATLVKLTASYAPQKESGARADSAAVDTRRLESKTL